MKTIWIVSYFDYGDTEATVTAFDNQTAALSCCECFKKEHRFVFIDEVPVYKSFTMN